MKGTASVLFMLLFMSCLPDKKENPDEVQGLFSPKMDSLIHTNGFNGVVMVMQDTTVLYQQATGYSDLQHQIPLHSENQFVIGSISKQITAVLILRAYEKGMIDLAAPVGYYLTDLTQLWAQEVTVHHLLTHTHGIVDLDAPLAFQPGTQFQYSQLGYFLLGQILEKITGNTFKELSTKLFKKYGLNHTKYPDGIAEGNLVIGYEEIEDGKIARSKSNADHFVAAGGFISNAHDLGKWNYLLYSGKLVQPETLKLMKTKYATRMHPVMGKIAYGYGLLFMETEEEIQLGAFGYVPGFASACYFYPKSNMSLIVLQNVCRNPDDLKKTFAVHTACMNMVKEESYLYSFRENEKRASRLRNPKIFL